VTIVAFRGAGPKILVTANASLMESIRTLENFGIFYFFRVVAVQTVFGWKRRFFRPVMALAAGDEGSVIIVWVVMTVKA
jgi:hypothetical protein